jgi:hypothetical protein
MDRKCAVGVEIRLPTRAKQFEHDDSAGGGPSNQTSPSGSIDKAFQRMEAHAGGDIEGHVAVVDPVAPQRGII